MAELRLADNQLHGWGPHSPCMRCGAPSTCVVRKTFTQRRMSGRYYRSQLLRQLDFLLMLLTPRRKDVTVPLCGRHKGHWRRYNLLVAGFAFLLLVFYAGLVAGLVWKWGSLLDPRNKDAVGYLVLGILGGAFALVVPAAIWVKAPIRAKWIDERGITLTGVADTFPGAVKPGQRTGG
jgi:hypothetical protein